MKLRITISKYHSWYLCQISLQIMLLPIQIIRMTLKSDEPFWNRRIPSVPMFIWLKSVICEMKGRQGVKTLIQNPFPFPFEFNSPPHRLKLVSLFFPSYQFPFPFRHLLCRLLYTEGQQFLKLWRYPLDIWLTTVLNTCSF